jgi:hypothetical protein
MLFTRLMPSVISRVNNPLSAASAASLRNADFRLMIDYEPSLRVSSETRHRSRLPLVSGPRRLLEPDQELLRRHVIHTIL